MARLRAYAEPDTRRSILQLLVSAPAFAGLWLAMLWFTDSRYWLSLLLAVPAAAFLLRLFVIQHDCGHRSFLRSRRANDLLGRAIGVVTLTPYDYWRRSHAVHHATSGNLDQRGVGDVTTLTVGEYRARSWRGRLAYRVYRHPLVLFGLGPLYLFVLKHRLPLDLPLREGRSWVSVMATNAAIAALAAALVAAVGPAAFVKVQLPVTYLASAAGIWMFFVQHQFEDAYWRPKAQWSYHQAAVAGSSYYRLPRLLQWFTGHIGLHHVHHLYSRIPNYRLQECLDGEPDLTAARCLTFADSLKCARLALWDEEAGRMIGFRELRAGTRRP